MLHVYDAEACLLKQRAPLPWLERLLANTRNQLFAELRRNLLMGDTAHGFAARANEAAWRQLGCQVSEQTDWISKMMQRGKHHNGIERPIGKWQAHAVCQNILDMSLSMQPPLHRAEDKTIGIDIKIEQASIPQFHAGPQQHRCRIAAEF